MVISFVTFLYLIYYSNILIEDKNLIFTLCFTFSTISPIATFYFLKKNNLISDLDASKKEERLLPMAFGALFFLLGFVTLRMLNAQLLIQGIMFCGMINVILAWLITNYWKISIHAITLSSSITIFWIFGYLLRLMTLDTRTHTNAPATNSATPPGHASVGAGAWSHAALHVTSSACDDSRAHTLHQKALWWKQGGEG